MKTVNDDTYGFYEEGGWSFLTGTGSVSIRSDPHAELMIQDDGSSESSEGSEFGGGGAGSDAASSVASSEDSDSASDCKLTAAVNQPVKLIVQSAMETVIQRDQAHSTGKKMKKEKIGMNSKQRLREVS